MSKRNMDKKVIILAILVLFGGAAFTATSFCIYYLVKPLNATWLIVLCVVDFLYNLFATCLFFKIMDAIKRLSIICNIYSGVYYCCSAFHSFLRCY